MYTTYLPLKLKCPVLLHMYMYVYNNPLSECNGLYNSSLSCWVVSTMHFNSKATPTIDTNYSGVQPYVAINFIKRV